MPVVLSQSWEGALISAVGAKMSAVKARGWQQTAGRLVFKHRRAHHHLHYFAGLYRQMLEAVRSSIPTRQSQEPVSSGYAGPLLEELYFNLDGFFEAVRATHDASLSCLGSAGLLLHPPSSLHDFFKKRDAKSNDSGTVAPIVKGMLLDFWRTTGSVAKDYRDCLSHYVSLSGPTWQHGANARWAHGQWTMTIELPDNPTARTYGALTFNSRLDAFILCQRIHRETDALIRAVLGKIAEQWQLDSISSRPSEMTVTNVLIGE